MRVRSGRVELRSIGPEQVGKALPTRSGSLTDRQDQRLVAPRGTARSAEQAGSEGGMCEGGRSEGDLCNSHGFVSDRLGP